MMSAPAQHLAHFLAHLIQAVGFAVRHAGVGGEHFVLAAGEHPTVAVTAGDGEGGDADLEKRAGDDAGLDRSLDAGVGPARIAHRSQPGFQCAAQMVHGVVEAHGERRLHVLDDVCFVMT